MRRRFFVERFDGDRAVLRGQAAHHLGRVLRARPGQFYELSDGQTVRLARTERVSAAAVEFALLESLPVRQPRLHTTLLLAIVKFDRLEWSLEKATELDVNEIVPLAAARSEKALVAAAAKRAERWRKILVDSAQQSRRLRPAVLREASRAAVRPADAFCGERAAIRIVLSERPEAPALRVVLAGKQATSAALAIGPEGGWTDEELASARAAGFEEASLGANILRTETAVVAALAILNSVLGE